MTAPVSSRALDKRPKYLPQLFAPESFANIPLKTKYWISKRSAISRSIWLICFSGSLIGPKPTPTWADGMESPFALTTSYARARSSCDQRLAGNRPCFFIGRIRGSIDEKPMLFSFTMAPSKSVCNSFPRPKV